MDFDVMMQIFDHLSCNQVLQALQGRPNDIRQYTNHRFPGSLNHMPAHMNVTDYFRALCNNDLKIVDIEYNGVSRGQILIDHADQLSLTLIQISRQITGTLPIHRTPFVYTLRDDQGTKLKIDPALHIMDHVDMGPNLYPGARNLLTDFRSYVGQTMDRFTIWPNLKTIFVHDNAPGAPVNYPLGTVPNLF